MGLDAGSRLQAALPTLGLPHATDNFLCYKELLIYNQMYIYHNI